MSITAPEMDVLKARLRTTWMAGDFGQIATSYAPGAVEFITRLHIEPETRVLDVACGTGNLSIPSARSGARVTGVDIATNWLDQARVWASAEGLTIQFDEGDAEQLPYADAAFDIIVSMFGAMFAPRPEQTAAELVRVCRPGGRIALANWTPSSFIGQMFKITAAHVPPPAGVPSPLLWGDETTVQERLRDGITDLQLTRRPITLTFPFGAPEVVEHFRLYYGPSQRAFAALNADGQSALRRDLERLWSEHNRATDGTTHVASEYLEVVATRS